MKIEDEPRRVNTLKTANEGNKRGKRDSMNPGMQCNLNAVGALGFNPSQD